MKVLIALVTLVGLGSVAATVIVGARTNEPTVVANPYEEGLRYDEARHHEAAVRASTGSARTGAASAGTGAASAGTGAESAGTGAASAGTGAESARPEPVEGRAALSLDISPRPPRAMADLEFTVRGAPAGSDVSLSLTMPGMFMGENRVALAPAEGGVHRGRGVVVRCPGGGRTWAADVEARPRDGAPIRQRFTFEVAER